MGTGRYQPLGDGAQAVRSELPPLAAAERAPRADRAGSPDPSRHGTTVQCDTDAYWSAVATTLPLVALALVVEARALHATWLDMPRWLRVATSLFWGGTLMTLALGESAALNALRGDDVSSKWPTAINYAVSFSMSALVVGPALLLLAKGNAELLVRVLTVHPLLRLRKSWARIGFFRRGLRLERQVVRDIRRAESMLDEIRELHNDLAVMVALGETPEPPPELARRIRSTHLEAERAVDHLKRHLQEVRDYRAALRENMRSLETKLSEIIVKERRYGVLALSRLELTLTGPINAELARLVAEVEGESADQGSSVKDEPQSPTQPA